MTTTLPQLLAASRAFALRKAVVATLAATFAVPVTVRAHPGRLDMSDVEKDAAMFQPPAIWVGVSRLLAAEERLSGHRDVPVEVTAYVVAVDTIVDGLSVHRDEIGLALCDAVVAIAESFDVSRWGLADIAPPEDVVAVPLFTSIQAEHGTAFFAVTWRQVLYSLGLPVLDLDSTVPPDAAVTVRLPGDPGWTP